MTDVFEDIIARNNIEEEMFIRITNLIGEMSWGIDLPSPMSVVMQSQDGEPQKLYAVDPENYHIVFAAIYTKLKKNPYYSPLKIMDTKLQAAYNDVIRLEKELVAAQKSVNKG
jgi:hypothetical protein